MTPEERAAYVYRHLEQMCGIPCPEGVPCDCASDQLIIASAIRTAENEALERAAAECERMKLYPGGRQEAPAHNDVWRAAEAIRAFKSTPPQADGEQG